MSIFEAVRILDLTRLLPGAYCSLFFADLGAEVIKIEEPGVGDYARWASPALEATSQGAGFEMLNRNKKSLTLNLKDESGKAILRRLVESADVLLESFRPGVMERLGLGYETLRQINSRLVYCAISGYGQHGPYRDLAGHDINYLGYAGALSITGPREGPPVLPGVQVADIGGGSLLAAFTIAAALYHRNQSGRGQMLDVSMTDGVISWLGYQFGVFFATGKAPATIIQAMGLVQISDTSKLEAAIRSAMQANPSQVADYKAGKVKLLGFFVGQVMKETKGQANPAILNDLVKKLLD